MEPIERAIRFEGNNKYQFSYFCVHIFRNQRSIKVGTVTLPTVTLVAPIEITFAREYVQPVIKALQEWKGKCHIKKTRYFFF